MAAEKSKIIYYPVVGTTPKAIYESIKKSSPRVARNATFAFTAIATKSDKATRKSKSGCNYSSFRTSALYIFTLPRLANAKGVSSALASKWASFAQYLRSHEEGHRAIWRSCLTRYDAGVLKLTAKTCEALDKNREKFFTAIKKRCLRDDEAYDFIFRKDVLRQPFVKAALGHQ
jgi:predicted secreted Zn-dependent protease